MGNTKTAWVILKAVRKRRPSTESFIKYKLKNDGADPTACGEVIKGRTKIQDGLF